MRPPAPDLPGKREEPIDVFGLIDASIFHFEMKRIRRGREPQVAAASGITADTLPDSERRRILENAAESHAYAIRPRGFATQTI